MNKKINLILSITAAVAVFSSIHSADQVDLAGALRSMSSRIEAELQQRGLDVALPPSPAGQPMGGPGIPTREEEPAVEAEIVELHFDADMIQDLTRQNWADVHSALPLPPEGTSFIPDSNVQDLGNGNNWAHWMAIRNLTGEDAADLFESLASINPCALFTPRGSTLPAQLINERRPATKELFCAAIETFVNEGLQCFSEEDGVLVEIPVEIPPKCHVEL